MRPADEPSHAPLSVVEPRARRFNLIAISICVALLISFAALSYSAIRGKSATSDEPLHLVGGFVRLHEGDFRLDPEDPALFGYWASLPLSRSAIKLNNQSLRWNAILSGDNQASWSFVTETLYQTRENDADYLLNTSRFMFILVGVALGATIAWWSWKLAGAWAAIAATTLYALDPNFLGHAGIIKNDVPFSLAILLLLIGLWRFGIRGTWLNIVGISGACALAINVKFSGLFCGPVIIVMTLIRALLPQEWSIANFPLRTRLHRLLVLPAVWLVIGISVYLSIWACYRFRFAPTTDPSIALNLDRQINEVKKHLVLFRYKLGDDIPLKEIEQQRPDGFTNAVIFAQKHQLFPQAWLYGLLYTYATTLNRGGFLLGEIRTTGWWYYFPCTFLFKTPTATLLMIPAAIAAASIALRKTYSTMASIRSLNWWAIACVSVPAGMYFVSAMRTHMNLGQRHIFPIYPAIFIALGVGFALSIRHFRVATLIAGATLSLVLAAESFASYPHYIAFFNAPSGSSTGGFRLLSDCNLDWGQDLKLLADWQKSHRDKRLYLNYFGPADPRYYGIDAVHVPGGWIGADAYALPASADERCYMAISVTNLHGVYYPPDLREIYQPFTLCDPITILGGSIYIYEMPVTARRAK